MMILKIIMPIAAALNQTYGLCHLFKPTGDFDGSILMVYSSKIVTGMVIGTGRCWLDTLGRITCSQRQERFYLVLTQIGHQVAIILIAVIVTPHALFAAKKVITSDEGIAL